MVKTKRGNRIRHLIWLATTWSIWKHRNNVVFNGGLPNASVLLENLKAISWIWFSGSSGRLFLVLCKLVYWSSCLS
jgi:hypothetical protein